MMILLTVISKRYEIFITCILKLVPVQSEILLSLMTCECPFWLIQVQRKILARGDEISAEEEIADLVFVQVCDLWLDFLY